LSLNGIVTFPPRKNVPPEDWLEVVAKNVPLDHLLLETDAPYLAPMPHRGERNEPAWTEETGKFIAKLRGISEGELFERVLKNTYTCFERLGR
jgi:TatD DNase family protein